MTKRYRSMVLKELRVVSRPVPDKPARLLYDAVSKTLFIEYLGEDNNLYRVPLVFVALPPEFNKLAEQLGLESLLSISGSLGSVELAKVSGVALTGRDWSSDFAKLQNLDVLLSSRASEATLQSVLSKLDVSLSSRASEATLQSLLSKLDVALSTRASESTLSSIKSQTDKLTFDASGYLQVNAQAVANPPNLDVALSTRASEATLSAIKSKTDNLDVALSSLRDAVLSKIDEIGKLVLLDYTTTALAASASWTSAVDSDPATGRIVGSVYADQAGTLYVEQSPNGTNWDVVDSFSVSAGAGLGFSVEKVCPYARVRYVNGATAQTVFRLYVYKRLRVI